MRHLILDMQILWAVFRREVLQTNAIFLFGTLFLALVATLQWLFNIEQLWYILQKDDLSFIDKLSFVLEGLSQIFLQWNNIVPIALILIALLQAFTFTFILTRRIKNRVKVKRSLGLAVLGAGCVACGGSVLVPLISVFVANVSIGFVRTIGNILLVLAVVLSYQACSKVVLGYAAHKYKPQ